MNRYALSICIILVMCAGWCASANPILLAPSGSTLTTGQIRAEAAFSPNNKHGSCYWLGTGFQQYEINVLRVEGENDDDQNRFGVQWNFLPETMFTPAVSFGVTDVFSQSDESTGIYAAITRDLPVGKASPFISSFSATLGIGAFGIKGPFAGFEAGLPGRMFLQADYDSRDLNAALGWQPVRYVRVKVYNLRDDFYLGAELVPLEF